MTLQALLDYKKINDELDKLEKQYNEESVVVDFNKCGRASKELTATIEKANADADEISAQMKLLADRYQEALRTLEEHQDTLAHIEDEKEADYLIRAIEKWVSTVAQLASEIAALTKRVTDMQSAFDKATTSYKTAVMQGRALKPEFDKVVATYRPQIADIKTRLKQAEALVAPDQLKHYVALRQMKTKHPIVRLSGNTCGGCYMEVDVSTRGKINVDGYVLCQNCGRILYSLDD